MGAQVMIINIDVWVVVLLGGGFISFSLWVIWILLQRLSIMTIEGIHKEISKGQLMLATKIAEAYLHAEHAHTRVGRVEQTLMAKGVRDV